MLEIVQRVVCEVVSMSGPAVALAQPDVGGLLDRVMVEYCDESGVSVWDELFTGWPVRFERCPPVPDPPPPVGRGFPGLWWTATTGSHVGFESWLQRDQLILLDFEAAVVGISHRPLVLRWAADDLRYIPDYFARLADGTAVLADCRGSDAPTGTTEVDERVEAVCELLGWRHRRVRPAGGVLMANVRWLAGYRHPRYLNASFAQALRDAFTVPQSLSQGATAVGDPIAVHPSLFHLLWTNRLHADLAGGLLGPGTILSTRSRGDP